ncbi:unnamed protein product [Prorocentrum cordatum]|uniref:Uncharacterized protein n=1 Tax=Prorocentrum cordatum TaxID=2364126 RepID=A0ABN9XVR9_9DINO|nr:unnamed protein product [Polarella glacialis]
MGRKRAASAAAPAAGGPSGDAGGRGARGGARGRGSGRGKRAKTASASEREATLVGPLVIRKKTTDTSGGGVCGRCGATESSDNPFPDAKMPNEQIQKFAHACSYHFCGYVKGKFWMDFNWSSMCATCEQDEELAESFEAACETIDGSREASSLPQAVSTDHQTGIMVFPDCILITEKQYQADIAPTGASALLPSQAGERETTLQNEMKGESVTGILARDPQSPYLKARRFSTVMGSRVEKALSAEDYCKDGAGIACEDVINRLLREGLPVSLRGHVDIPTVSELKLRAVGAARALGLVGPDGPHGLSQVAGGGPLAIADAIVDGTVGDSGLAAQGPRGGQATRSGGAVVAQQPESEACGHVPDGLDGDGASVPRLDVTAEPSVAGNRSDRRGSASAAACQTPPSAKGKTPPADAKERDRYQEIVASINMGLLLTKGANHSTGDRIYALKRFKPKSELIESLQRTALADIETCTSLGGNALEVMSLDTRVRLLKKIRRVKLDGAESWMINLCAVATREANDPSIKVDIALPWKSYTVGDFSPLAPSMAEVGIAADRIIDEGRDFFISNVVLPLTRADVVDTEYMSALISALLVRVGDQTIREEAGPCKNLAYEIFVFTEAVRVLLDSSPTALLECTCRSDVRKLLREEFGATRRTVVTTFGAEWQEVLAEYNRAYFSDVKYGEKVKHVMDIVSGPTPISDASIQDVIGNLLEWGAFLRKGAASGMLDSFHEQVVGWIGVQTAQLEQGGHTPTMDFSKSLNLKLLELISEMPKIRGVDEVAIQKFNKLQSNVEAMGSKFHIHGQATKLREACSQFDPSDANSVKTITGALNSTMGELFGSQACVAAMGSCAQVCLSHAAAVGADSAKRCDFTSNLADYAEKIKTIAMIATALLNRILDPNAEAKHMMTTCKCLRILLTLMVQVGELVKVEPFSEVNDAVIEASADDNPAQPGNPTAPRGSNLEDYKPAPAMLEFAGLAKSVVQKARAVIKEFSGGMFNNGGEHWSKGAELETWEQLSDHAKRTLFKQKGITVTVRNREKELHNHMVSLKEIAADHGAKDQYTEFEKKAADIKETLFAFRDELHDAKLFSEKDAHPMVTMKFEAMQAEANNEQH